MYILYSKGRYSESEICHEGVDWINVVHVRNSWRVLIISSISSSLSLKYAEFITRWTAGSLWRNTAASS